MNKLIPHKVDKRYEMYPVKNANYCISMSGDLYIKIRSYIVEEYGDPTHASHALGQKCEVGKWYYDTVFNTSSCVTVYFPKKQDVELVINFMTFGKLK